MQDSATMYNALTFTLILSVLLCVYADPVVKIGNTNVIGSVSGSSGKVDFFGGIPFAEPPLGELRLNFPVLSTTLNTETLVARDFGPGCLQVPAPPSGLSEDCLTLDVYRPAGISSEAKLPVLVWIYGGGFVVGATSFYNATDIVTRSVSRGTPIVFVSINYRVGPLGFPQGVEAGQRNILNLGLHDQVTALQWVQQNIHNFGGDKTKVTISGESAGAGSIQIFFLTSKIAGLARGAILESTGLLPAFVPERNEVNWQEYVNAIPACASSGVNDTFDCIRSATSSSLEQALVATNINFNNMSFVPVIDGPGGFMPDRVSQIKNENNLPSILGSNRDEGTIFTPQTLNSAAEIEERLTAMISPPLVSPQQLEFGEQQLLKLYPDIPALESPFGTGNDTFGLSPEYKRYAAMFGDFIFHSARRTLSQQLSEAGVPAFAYHFTDPDAVAVAEFAPSSPAPGSIGTPHTSEIPYVFGTLMNITPRAIALSAVMQDYWISFVNNLDPNDERGGQRPKWEQYVPKNQVILNLNSGLISTMPDNFRKAQIAFLQNNPGLLHR